MKPSTKKRFEENKKKMDFYNQDGTKPQQHKRNNNGKGKRPFVKKEKIKPVSYMITSDVPDTAFFDVLTIMTDSCKILDGFITEHTYPEEKERMFNDYDFAMLALSNAAIETFPQLIAKKNIHSVLSVSANKIHVRLEAGIAFTIETKYQIVDKTAQIVSCTGTITLYDKNDDLINDLLDNGFTLVERN